MRNPTHTARQIDGRETPVTPRGGMVFIRAVSSGDEEGLRGMFSRLSPETIYRRFHAPFPRVPEWALPLFTKSRWRHGESLVAVVGDEIIGHAMFVKPGDDSGSAEVAVVVEDGWQSKGVGKLLLLRLAEEAGHRGVEVFTGEVLGENRPMLGLFEAVFSRVEYGISGGSYHVRAPLRPPEPVAGPARTPRRAA